MKFTKIVAASLLTLGFTQLMKADEITVDLSGKNGAISLPDQASGDNRAFYQAGDIIHLMLDENPTTGFENIIVSTPKFLKLISSNYTPSQPPVAKESEEDQDVTPDEDVPVEPSALVGAGGTRTFDFEVLSGNFTDEELNEPLKISYARSWVKSDRPETYIVTFKVQSSLQAAQPKKGKKKPVHKTTHKKVKKN